MLGPQPLARRKEVVWSVAGRWCILGSSMDVWPPRGGNPSDPTQPAALVSLASQVRYRGREDTPAPAGWRCWPDGASPSSTGHPCACWLEIYKVR